MATKYITWPYNKPNGQIIYPTSSIARPSQIYPNWDFSFENYDIWQPCPIFLERAMGLASGKYLFENTINIFNWASLQRRMKRIRPDRIAQSWRGNRRAGAG
jgi:hypothetical protein